MIEAWDLWRFKYSMCEAFRWAGDGIQSPGDQVDSSVGFNTLLDFEVCPKYLELGNLSTGNVN